MSKKIVLLKTFPIMGISLWHIGKVSLNLDLDFYFNRYNRWYVLKKGYGRLYDIIKLEKNGGCDIIMIE